MSQQEVSGTLADGGTYRATSYMVEVIGPSGETTETIDLGEVTEVRRAGQDVIFKRRKGKDLVLRAATLADAGRLEAMVRPTVPAATAKAGGGFGKVVRWGCLGTIGLVTVIVVIMIATSLGDDAGGGTSASSVTSGSTSTQASGTKEVGTNKGDVHVPLAAGQSGEVNEAKDKTHKVTIVKITDDAQSTNQFERPAEGNKFWAVEVLVENAGQAEIYGGTWKLRGTNDFEYDPTIAVGIGQPLNLLQNLTSGAKTQGTLVFEIPKDAQPKFLRYDPNTFVKGDLYFDAQ